ncbi:S8 family peptidase [Brevibacillus sp. SYSU BS000544]|uniref:S8 family peptidase n=1 Tax=Brevibacillus sp. SYSU BS000544 TaxID=3416443 RepID=UPI003CE519D1
MNLHSIRNPIPLLGVTLLISSLVISSPITAEEAPQPSLYEQEKAKEPEHQVDNQLLIVWNTSSSKKQTGVLSILQGRSAPVISQNKQITPEVSLITLQPETDTERVMKELAKNPEIQSVEPNQTIRALLPRPGGPRVNLAKADVVGRYVRSTTATDPLLENQWAHPLLHVQESWELLQPSQKSVTVAVIDTGADLSHPDLADILLPGKDYIDKDDTPLDLHGHGTHVSGIIAAISDNSVGITGLTGKADVKILPMKVLDSNGEGTVASEVQAIYDAVAMGANVINLSLGSDEYSQAERNAVRYAVQQGVMVVAATGNEYASVGYPAAYAEAVAVGATNQSDNVPDFSNFGSQVDLVAPGVDILSTVPREINKSGYDYSTGTSMATPHVAALAALLMTQLPDATSSEIEQIMKDTAVDLGTKGKDKYAGYGRIDFLAAIQKAKEAAQPPAKTYTLSELQADPSLFHQLLASYPSSQITVKAADGSTYLWKDLVSQSATMASIFKQDPALVEITFSSQ